MTRVAAGREVSAASVWAPSDRSLVSAVDAPSSWGGAGGMQSALVRGKGNHQQNGHGVRSLRDVEGKRHGLGGNWGAA